MATPSENEVFICFMGAMEDLDTTAEDGMVCIQSIPEEKFQGNAHVWKEWQYWRTAAEAAASLNLKENASKCTLAAVKILLEKYMLQHTPITRPISNMGQGLMKFTNHQLWHAFAALNGLPPRDKEGGRTFDHPAEAMAEAFDGNAQKEAEIGRLWRHWIKETVQEVGFDMTAIE